MTRKGLARIFRGAAKKSDKHEYGDFTCVLIMEVPGFTRKSKYAARERYEDFYGIGEPAEGTFVFFDSGAEETDDEMKNIRVMCLLLAAEAALTGDL